MDMEDQIDGSKLDTFKEFTSFNDADFSFYKDIPCSKLENWKDLHNLLSNKIFDDEDILFRGQSDANWGLIPLLNRINNEPEEDFIKNTLIRFKETLLEMGFKEYSELEDEQLWALGRHHGLPTPILDWTSNPYVALYFAMVASIENKGFSSIYILKRGLAVETLKKVVFYQTNYHENKRELAQHGTYSFTTSVDDFEALIRQDKNNSPNYFRKIIFKNRDSTNCRRFLSKLGVTPKHLFPNSLDGAVEYCRSFIPIKMIARNLTLLTIKISKFNIEEEAAKINKTLVNNSEYSSYDNKDIEFASKAIANEMLKIYQCPQLNDEVKRQVKEYFEIRFPK